jgi:hypothetical protein
MARPDETSSSAVAAALLDPDLPPPQGLKTWRGGPVDRRFAVYRNNVTAGLIDALEQRFPVCLRLVGNEFFRAMAGAYVRNFLPRSPILTEYGEDFSEFVAGFAPACELAYLPDVARLEYAIGRAYHAPDAEPLSFQEIRAISVERFVSATLSLHPSVQLTPSRFPLVSIWRTNMFDTQVSAVETDCAEDAMAIRPHLEVSVHALPPGALGFIHALAAGETIARAAAEAQFAARNFDLGASFQLLISIGAIIAIGLEDGCRQNAEA